MRGTDTSSIGTTAGAALRAGAAVGGVAGALRIVSAFVPYSANSLPLEAFYAVIDLGLLFGTIAVYLYVAQRVGWLGVTGFVVAAAGLASIVGPDGHLFGVDMWRLGVVVISVGLGMFTLSLHRNCPDMRVPVRLWGAYLLAFIFTALGMTGTFGGMLGGVLFGTGYVAAAIVVMTNGGASAREA